MAELSRGTFEDKSGLLLYHCAVPDPVVWNGAIVTGATSADPNELLQCADAFFASRTDSYGFWVVASRDAALAQCLADNGAEQIDDSPHMVVECSAVLRPITSASVEVVTDEVGRSAFVEVAAAGFATIGARPAVWPVAYPSAATLCADDVIAVIASEDGMPLGAAMGYLAGDVCEVIHVATVPQARRRGIGAAVTSGVLVEAEARGAKVGALQATEHGEGVYRSLGFEEVDRYRLHLRIVPGP
jgi:ribosomal protein S18 acetylase RimI-like enzyme